MSFHGTPALQFDQVYVQNAFGSWTPVSGVFDDSIDDRGLASLLIDCAVEAKKIDDLRGRLEARAKLPLAELNAKIMLALLALRTRDEAAAKNAVEVLVARIKKDSLLATNTSVGTLLTPLLTDPACGEQVVPLLEKVAENHDLGHAAGERSAIQLARLSAKENEAEAGNSIGGRSSEPALRTKRLRYAMPWPRNI